jgi:hypothetical protein
MNPSEMYNTIAVYDGRYCLSGVAAFAPQDQDPTVKTALFLGFLLPTFNILLFK